MGQKTHVSAGLRRILQVRWAEGRQGHASPSAEVHFVKALIGDARLAPGVVVSAHAERGTEVEVSGSFDFADLLAPGMPLTLETGLKITMQASAATILTLTHFPPEVEALQIENPISLSCMGGEHFEFTGELTFEAGFSAKVAVGFSTKDGAANGDYTKFEKPGEEGDGVIGAAKLQAEAKALVKASGGVQYVAVTCRDQSPLCYRNVQDPLMSAHIETLLGKDKTEIKNAALDVFKMTELTPAGRALLPSEAKDRFKSLVSGTIFSGMGRLIGNVRKDVILQALDTLERGLAPPPASGSSASPVRYCAAGAEDKVRQAITAARAGLTAFYGFSQSKAQKEASAALVVRGQQGPTDWKDASERRNERRGYSFLSICGMKSFASVGVEAGFEIAALVAHATAGASATGTGHVNRTSYRYQALTYNTSMAKRASGAPSGPERFGVVTQDTVVYYTSAKVVKEVEVSAQLLHMNAEPETVEHFNRKHNADTSVARKEVHVGGRAYELTREYGRVNAMTYHSSIVYWVPPSPPQSGSSTTTVSPQKGSGLAWGRSFELSVIADACGARSVSDPVRNEAIDHIAGALEVSRAEIAAFLADARETVEELLQQAPTGPSGHGSSAPQCSALLIEVAATCAQLPSIEARAEIVDGRRTWVLPPVTVLSKDSFFDRLKAQKSTLRIESFRLRVRQTDLVTNDALLFKASFRLGADQDIEGKNGFVLRSVDRMGADAVIDLFTYHPSSAGVLQAPSTAAPKRSPAQNRFVQRFKGSLDRAFAVKILQHYQKTLSSDATAVAEGNAFLKVLPGWDGAADPADLIARKVGPMLGRPLAATDVATDLDVVLLLADIVAPDMAAMSALEPQVRKAMARMQGWTILRKFAELESHLWDELLVGDDDATRRVAASIAELSLLTGGRIDAHERGIDDLRAAVIAKGLPLEPGDLVPGHTAEAFLNAHKSDFERDKADLVAQSRALLVAASDRGQLHAALAKEGPVPRCPVPPVALFYR